MKSGYLVHVFAVMTLLLGVWIFVNKISSDDNAGVSSQVSSPEKDAKASSDPTQQATQTIVGLNDSPSIQDATDNTGQSSDASGATDVKSDNNVALQAINPDAILHDYVIAWQSQNKAKVDRLWEQVINCEKCLALFVDQVVERKFEEGLILEVAIKMAALDTDIVLPAFDALIDPAGDKSTAIILSEKLIRNGRPELVTKIFDLIYRAKQSGYHHFAQQLTWVISKLENPKGIEPVLDTITGRKLTNPELSSHVTNVYSKVVRIIPEESNAGSIIADYYMQANSQEQQKLWPVVSQHGRTLVRLAVEADKNGQNFNVQKYASAISELPHLNAVDSLMQLHTAVEYSPGYLRSMLSNKVADNPTIKVLHKLEDYMRNPNVKLESRLFAAEGLLAVRQNRQARYILEKVINNTEETDVELQAYIGGRL